MSELLTLSEAAQLAGVPPEQMKRWAWETTKYEQHGPRNVGTRNRPKYREEDVLQWLDKRSSWRQAAYDRLDAMTSVHSVADHTGGIDRSPSKFWNNQRRNADPKIAS